MKKSFIEFLKTHLSSIITTIIMIALILISFVTLGLESNFGKEFWANLCIVFLLQVLMIALWTPEGKKRGEENDEYKKTKTGLNQKMNEASNHYAELDEFCKQATDKNRIAYTAKRLQRYGVNYARCGEEAYLSQLTEKQRKLIVRFEKKALSAVKPIKSTQVTSNSKIHHVFDVESHEKSSEAVTLTIKLVGSIVSSIVGAIVTWGSAGFSWSKLARLFYYMGITGATIVFSIRTGINLVAVTRKDYYIRIIDFLDRFEKWRKGLSSD